MWTVWIQTKLAISGQVAELLYTFDSLAAALLCEKQRDYKGICRVYRPDGRLYATLAK